MSRTTSTEAVASRFDVSSADGTSIAVWTEGAGPPLVLVHGSLGDHDHFQALVPELANRVGTFAVDRRGFGASSDTAPYAIEREFEDVAAVVDAVADRCQGPVALFGHSYGASCAMGGAAASANVSHLVLYEPSLGLRYPPGSVENVERALAAGDPEAAIRLVLVEILELTEADIAAMRASPLWPMRVAAAPTVPRECRAEEAWTYRAGSFDDVDAEILFLAGSESPAAVREATDRAVAALPGARVHVLEGHGHAAHRADPAMVADLVVDFVR